ncbi:MAG: pyridoxamine 5'-phosphate oxidase family protein [Gudongella sp.]|nr:pyridoxamine 5'-phosphate oxidase family protein [Gudongella sp.]
MRRKDREMDRKFALEVIDKSKYGIVSVVDKNNMPYSVPISIVRDGDMLYFHSAMAGDKVELYNLEPRANIVFVGEVQVPNLYSKDELDELLKDKKNANLVVSTIFTTEFESAIVQGRINRIEDQNQKIKVLKLICEKYTPDKMELFDIGVEAGVDKVLIYGIKIEEITAKRKKFDESGKEMKWMRKG